jgi:hypothetical protein
MSKPVGRNRSIYLFQSANIAADGGELTDVFTRKECLRVCRADVGIEKPRPVPAFD